ncbi:AcrR family transcriptional regulator [Mumia flava]|uniref:AcrR family transcriptional regulator n=1 Tax=Mumia flava TaxID=1348852 RepID=A0A2M9BF19_9ACTN|nr:TetR family transcriptional regulator [Mumia flava]PJJ56547.1 AcrR family transcriptional regulator [Mumia flava]
MTRPAGPPGLSLRETKRRAAMARIQESALDLFDEHGYQQVTVEAIAAAAEVAPRTVYRYFGTKEGIILLQPEDDDAIEAIAAAAGTVDLVDAVRAVVPAFTGPEFTDRSGYWARVMHYALTVPELRRATFAFALELADRLAEAAATARGLPADDLATRVRSRAATAALTTGLAAWYSGSAPGTLAETVHAALDALDGSGSGSDETSPPDPSARVSE